MRYAALKALILIVVGIIFASYFKLSNIYYLIFFILSIISAFFTKGYSLYFVLFLASAINFNVYVSNQKALKSFPLYDTPLKIQAQIIEEPISEPRTFLYGHSEDNLHIDSSPLQLGAKVLDTSNRYTAKILSLNQSPISAKVFLYLKTTDRKFSYGNIIEVNSKISQFDFPRNPNLMDYNEYFYKQGYLGSVFTTGSEIKLVKQKQRNWFAQLLCIRTWIVQHLINPMRHYFFKTIDEFFDKDEKDLLLGMLIGETRGMSKTMRITFANAGVAHISAVSGLNVAILIGVLLLSLPIFRIRGIWELIIIIIITLLFLSIVGFKPSAVRAGLMAICASLGLFLERRYHILNGVFIAAIIILLISPQALTDIGFQLSFSAVIAIILISPKLYDAVKNKNIPKFILLYIILPSIVSFAAGIGIAPIILYYFFRLPVLSVFANLIIVPLVGIATPLGFFVVLINLFWHGLAGIFANTLWLCLKLIILVSTKFANLSFAVIEPGRPSILLIILFYLGVLLILFWNNLRLRKISLAIFLISINFCVWQRVLQTKHLSVTFLDIKQGDAIFLDLPNKRKMLIDAGEENEIVPQFLKSKGIKNIDLAVITHPHLDHYGGFINLLDDFKIRNFIIATDKPKDTLNKLYTNLIDSIKSKGIRIYYADRGQVIKGLGINVEVLSPDASLRRIYNMNVLDPNDLSIVLRITYNNTSFLLPGDLDDAKILKGFPVQSKILKSPHHGSKKANSQLLFSIVKPQYLIISGRKNIAQSTNDLINQEKIYPFNLRKDGALTIKAQKNKIILKDYKDKSML